MTTTFNFRIGQATPKGFFLNTEMVRQPGLPHPCPVQGPFSTEAEAMAAGDAFAAKVKASVAWNVRDNYKGGDINGTFSFSR